VKTGAAYRPSSILYTMNALKNASIRLAGPRSLLLLGDTLVLDRWRWLRSRLPAAPASLIDVGCGNGWLAINCSSLGYRTLGVGWAGSDLEKARKRATVFRTDASFEVQDARTLSTRYDLKECFDVATCCETIEHIIDDAELMRSLASTLRPSGRLILTTPNQDYVPMDAGDAGPFREIEDGGHVRKGYTPERLSYLAEQAGLEVAEIGFCSGWSSQKVTTLLRALTRRIGYGSAWALTLPLRLVPPLLDSRDQAHPAYSICMLATKV
jgi:2-polyprenyl-3-methyl-5-hydroxy-6-metoxy-1,4-benzoquinol methylase